LEAAVEKAFVGRQPIYRDGVDVFAYELFSRHSELNRAVFTDGDKATAQLLLDTFVDIGLDQVVGQHVAFVNVTRNFVVSEYCASLPKGRVVLELACDTALDQPLLDALSLLSRAGYSIALDNFVFSEEIRPLLSIASIIKIDIGAMDRNEIALQVAILREYDVKLLAQKVETHEQYEYCRQLGFDYYQGFFFCKPQIVSRRIIPFNRLSTLHLIARLQDPKISIDEIELAVGQNLAISHRILRYLNSPMHAFHREIESLRHGIALVGTRLICNWASMILLEAIEEKPRELMVTSMVRAHMCRQLGAAMGERNLDQFFTAGLFSLIDAVMDCPMAEVLGRLGLVESVKNAILQRKGAIGTALKRLGSDHVRRSYRKRDPRCLPEQRRLGPHDLSGNRFRRVILLHPHGLSIFSWRWRQKR
jgi:EAL and modified HD-GYP domain-containing signal transduction protein